MPDDQVVDELDPSEDPVTVLGDALARRIAQTAPQADVPEVSPTSTSTDSTDDGEVEDVVVPPVTATDASVAGEGAADPAAGDGEGGGGADEQSSVPSPSTFKVNDREYTTSDIERLTGLESWATNLAPELKQAFAAIEQGQAAAISADEYRKFQAWKVAQQGAQQPAHEDLLSDLDADQRSLFEQLRLENEQLRANLVPSQSDLATQQQIAEQQVVTLQQVSTSWGTEHGLDPAQVEALTDTAIRHGMFDHFARLEREFHPINGALIRDADMGSVTRKALNYALANDPGLYTQVLTSQQTAQQRAAAEQQADAAVSVKKARAASLSTAQSQASFAAPVDVKKMTPDEKKAGMAQMISQLENLPLHD